jgi:hypothetical protein
MASFETIVEMRETLKTMNGNLTPYSSKVEYQRFLDSLTHYKKILNAYIKNQNDELDSLIEKTNANIRNFIMKDIATIKSKIIDGRC